MHVVARPVVDGPTAAPAAHASLIVAVRIALPFVPAQRFYRRRFRLRRSLPNTLPPLHLKPLGFDYDLLAASGWDERMESLLTAL